MPAKAQTVADDALLLYAAGFAIAVHLFVIGYEEPTLRRRFGDEYLAYRQHVRRWIPGPSRRD